MNIPLFALRATNQLTRLRPWLTISAMVILGAPQLLTAQDLPPTGLHREHGEYWTNFSQTFPFHPDGRFGIDNVNGRIEIHGWDSNAVLVAVAIHGPTPNSLGTVKVNLEAAPDHAVVHTEQPAHHAEATVDYTVQAPRGARLAEVSVVNGRILIDGVAGDIAASTVNGEMQIKNAAHDLKLSTVNGRIQASLDRLGGGQSVSLDGVNGTLELALPEDADAKFSVSTVNGGIASDFPALQAKRAFPANNYWDGSLGRGSANVKISTVNGGVKFLKSELAASSPTAAKTGGSTVEKDAAVAAAQAWLALIDAGNWSASWQAASRLFQGGVKEPNWNDSMDTYRQPLGKVLSRELKSARAMTQMPGAPDGKYVVMQFNTSFANKKAAVETVTFDLEADGQWKSSGYFIK